MSSTSIEYYMLNGRLVGEFGLWAAVAGEIGVPTIFLSGDDKACTEAQSFIPNITTVAVKEGTGWETAINLPNHEVSEKLIVGIQLALQNTPKISPYRIEPPIHFELAYRDWRPIEFHIKKGAKRKGMRIAEHISPSLEALINQGII